MGLGGTDRCQADDGAPDAPGAGRAGAAPDCHAAVFRPAAQRAGVECRACRQRLGGSRAYSWLSASPGRAARSPCGKGGPACSAPPGTTRWGWSSTTTRTRSACPASPAGTVMGRTRGRWRRATTARTGRMPSLAGPLHVWRVKMA